MKKIKIYTALTIGIIFLAVSCSSSGTDNVVDTTQGVVTTEVSVDTTTTTEEFAVPTTPEGLIDIEKIGLNELIEVIFIEAEINDPFGIELEIVEVIQPKITAENIDSAIDKFRQENIEKYNNKYEEQVNSIIEKLETEVRRAVEPLPSHIDPRLRNHWIEYGEGPEGCDPEAPNYQPNACYQYQIGPGEPDPVDSSLPLVEWLIGYGEDERSVPVEPGKTCPQWRDDPTWVDEGLVPYFSIHSINRERNIAAKNYDEFSGYIAALAIVSGSETDYTANKNPSWENCLLYYSGLSNKTTTDIAKNIGGIAIRLEQGSYYISFTDHKNRSVFVYAIGNNGDAIGNICSDRAKLDPNAGAWKRNGELIRAYNTDSTGTEEINGQFYRHEYAIRFSVEDYDGKIITRRLSSTSSRTGSCEKDWETILPEEEKRANEQGYRIINRWYQIPEEAANEYAKANIVELESAIACLSGTTREDIFPNLENDRIRHLQLDFDSLTCDEVRATGKFNNILNLAPSTTERSSNSGGP